MCQAQIIKKVEKIRLYCETVSGSKGVLCMCRLDGWRIRGPREPVVKVVGPSPQALR